MDKDHPILERDHRVRRHLRPALLAINSRSPFSYPQTSAMLAILQFHSHTVFTAMIAFHHCLLIKSHEFLTKKCPALISAIFRGNQRRARFSYDDLLALFTFYESSTFCRAPPCSATRPRHRRPHRRVAENILPRNPTSVPVHFA